MLPRVLVTLSFCFHTLQITSGQGSLPSSERILKKAELLALQHGIQPTKLLIVDVGGSVLDTKRKFRASFFSGPAWLSTIPRNHTSGIPSTFPTLLDVLAADLGIIVIMTDNVFGQVPDLVQNIRHKCVAQMIIVRGFVYYVPSITTLSWSRFGTNLFCVRTYDQLVSLWWKRQNRCSQPALDCRLKAVGTETFLATEYSVYSSSLIFKCNATEVSVNLEASPETNRTTVDEYDRHSNTRYFLCQQDAVECSYPVLLAETNVTTLLKPFRLQVWLLMLAFTLFISKLLSWSGATDMISVCNQLILSFIGAAPVEVGFKRYSGLILACSAVSMTFLFGITYLNSVMSYFLDPTEWFEPKSFFDCHVTTFCDDTKFLKLDSFSEGVTLCGMTEKAKQSFGLPLKRLLYNNESQLRKAYSECHLQKIVNDKRHGIFGNTAQPLLSLPQKSVILDRLQQNGILSLHNFDKKKNRKRASGLTRKAGNQFTKAYVSWLVATQNLTNLNRKRFVSFDNVRDWFNMQSFQKLFPLFSICGCVSLTVALMEMAKHCVLSNWRRGLEFILKKCR